MGDDLASIVVDSVGKCVEEAGIELQDKDVIAITEAVVGISQGNYATADQIAKDVSSKFGDETVGLIFPIMSRNRCLTKNGQQHPVCGCVQRRTLDINTHNAIDPLIYPERQIHILRIQMGICGRTGNVIILQHPFRRTVFDLRAGKI